MLRPSPNHGTQRLPNDDDDIPRHSIHVNCEHLSHATMLSLSQENNSDSDSDSELFIRHCLPSNSTAYIMYN